MNKISLIIAILIVTILSTFTSCNTNDEITDPIIVIPEAPTSELDIWIDSIFRVPYNIDVEYKWNNSDVDQSHDLVPPKEALVKPFLQTVKKIWIDTYNQVASSGNNFMRDYTCRKLKLIGSGSYNSGSVTLGLAENGYKITLYTINDFNIETGVTRSKLREYFRVMHHEFSHILNQRKPYDVNFQNITGAYSSDWTTLNDSEARELGFISAYARSADTEDFVETLSFYVCYSETEWNSLLAGIDSEEGVKYIESKVQVVSSYMQDTYGVNLLELRTAILTAFDEVLNGDLD